MRGVWTIARVELRRFLRERTLLFFALALPVVITVVIGVTMFGDDRTYVLGVADEDGGEVAADLVAALAEAPGAELRRYDDGADLRAAVRRTNVDAGLIVPAGFGESVARGGHATVTLVGDPVDDDTASVRAAVAGVVAAQSQRVTAAGFAVRHASIDIDEATALTAQLAARQTPVPVRVVAAEGTEEPTSDNQFDYTAPSNLVLFVFINSLAVGAAIVESRRLGVVARVLSTPTSAATVIAGIGASRLLFALAQAAILVILGSLLFGVDWGDPLAALALVVVFAVVSAAAGVLVGSLVGNADQAMAVGIPAAIALGMLGGCMWPLFIVPDAMRIAGHVTPHAWAMDGWIELVYDGGGLSSIAVELAVLAGFALALSAAAVAALSRSVRRA